MQNQDNIIARAETARLLQAVCNNATVGLFIMDERQQCVYMNPAAEHMTGYKLAEVQGQPLHNVIHHTHPDGRPYPIEDCPIDRAFPQNNQEQGEDVFIHKDGHFYQVAYTASPIRDGDDVNGTVIEVVDITERKRAEAALRDSEARYRSIVEATPECVKIVAPDGALLDMNAAGLRMIEAGDLSQVQGLDVFGLITPEYRDRFKAFHQTVCDGKPAVLEFEIVGLGGTRRFMDTHAVPLDSGSGEVRHLAVTRDITARKLAEEALRDSERRFRSVFNQQFVFSAILSPEGRIIEVNDLPLKAGGLRRDDVIGKYFWDAGWCDDLPEMRESWKPRLQAAGELDGPQVTIDRYQAADGSIRVAEAAVSAVRNELGELEFFLVQANDITERERAQAKYLQEAERLRLACEATELGTWDYDPQSGQLEWSDTCKSCFGLPADARIDYDVFLAGLHPDDRDLTHAAVTKALDPNGDGKYDISYRTIGLEDRVERWVRATGRAIFTEGVASRFIGTIQDITEDKRTEAQLIAAAEKAVEYNATLEQLAEGVIVADAEGRISYLNGAAERMQGLKALGVTPSEYSDVYKLFTCDGEPYPSLDLPLARAVLRDEIVTDAQWVVRREDRDEIIVSGAAQPLRAPDGKKMGAVLTFHDDTQRTVAEAQLRETAERYRLASRATNDAIWDWDLLSNHVLWNEALYQVYGFDKASVAKTGDWWLSRIHPEDRDQVSHSIHAVIDGEGDHWTADYRFLNASDEAVHVHDRGYVIRNEDGHAIRMIGAMLDQTERRRTELALKTMNETLEERVTQAIAEREEIEQALRQAQKMEAVGQLTGGIAHDFNNMLAVVSGSLELLDRRIASEDPRAKRLIASALEASRRSSSLTQRLLAFSRQQPLQPEALNPNRLVSGMSDLFAHSLGAQVRLETVLAAGIWNIHADQNQLESVMLNLAVNALDAMPDGGKLTIETQNAYLDDRYAAGEVGVMPGQYVMIAVTDTGTGMPAEVIEKAFDPFFTTKEVGKGTGLGLSQVYGFVKQSGGHIKVYSEVGHGTTIKIYLPRHIGSSQADNPTDQADDLAIAEEQELILVVDDEPIVRQFSVDALTELGYRVLAADSAKSALALLKERPDVDLLFTDIVMPETNGRKLADLVKAFRPDLPVIYTTGYTRNAVVHNGIVDAGVHLIGKPFTIEQLALKVREVLETART